ncbi:MAG: hypothetical protein ACI4B5_04325 [Bacteroidaceae bacterium]
MAAAELREQGIEVIKGHFAYRVEGVEGYGFTDVVGRRGNTIYIIEAKNGPYARLTKFQRKAFQKMKEGAMVTFFGPKAEASNLPLDPISDYIFRLRRFVPQIRK